jgi:hypothetical protein
VITADIIHTGTTLADIRCLLTLINVVAELNLYISGYGGNHVVAVLTVAGDQTSGVVRLVDTVGGEGTRVGTLVVLHDRPTVAHQCVRAETIAIAGGDVVEKHLHHHVGSQSVSVEVDDDFRHDFSDFAGGLVEPVDLDASEEQRQLVVVEWVERLFDERR